MRRMDPASWPSGFLGPGGPKEGSNRRPAQGGCVAEGAFSCFACRPSPQRAGHDFVLFNQPGQMGPWVMGLWIALCHPAPRTFP